MRFVALLTAATIALAPMAKAAEPIQSRPIAKGCHSEAFVETAITVAAVSWLVFVIGGLLYTAGKHGAELEAAEKKYPGQPVTRVCEYKPDTAAQK